MKANWKMLIIIPSIVCAIIGGIPIIAWIVSQNSGLSFIQSVSVLQTVGTLSLSAILAYLYLDIRDIQANQEELMSVQYEPEIKATISSGSDSFPVILVRNTGLATALDIEIGLLYENDEKRTTHPFLSPKSTIEYPVYKEDTELSASEIIKRIEKEDSSKKERPFERNTEPIGNGLMCAISCKDIKGKTHHFEEKFELKSMIEQLENYKRRSEVDALEEISRELERVNDNLAETNNDLL